MYAIIWLNQCYSSSSDGKQNQTHNLVSCKQCKYLVTSEVIFSEHKRIIHMNIWFNQCCSDLKCDSTNVTLGHIMRIEICLIVVHSGQTYKIEFWAFSLILVSLMGNIFSKRCLQGPPWSPEWTTYSLSV